MILTLVRHGETIENKEKIIMGQLDGTLSELGIQQAKKLAERLKDERFDYIFSSDLARAANTAKEIVKYYSRLPIIFVEELRERNYGKLQGVKKDKILGWNEIKLEDKLFDNYKGVESTKQIYKRAGDFIESISLKYNNKKILMVAHNTINVNIIKNILGKPYNAKIETLENTSVSIFKIDRKGKGLVELLNCTKHLK